MKPDKKSKQDRPKKPVGKIDALAPISGQEQTDQLLPEQQTDSQVDKLAKFSLYFEKMAAFGESDPSKQRFFQTINFIHELMEQEEWFAENTPYPFKMTHYSAIAELAFLTCGYVKLGVATDVTGTIAATLDFVAHSINDVPRLLDEIRRLKEEIRDLKNPN